MTRHRVVLAIGFSVHFRAIQILNETDWNIETTGYVYSVFRDELEWFVYHWERDGSVNQTPSESHIHIGKYDRELNLARTHLPTGFVPLTSIFRMLMQDLDVAPLFIAARSEKHNLAAARALLDTAQGSILRSLV